jgi:hypothetical protein
MMVSGCTKFLTHDDPSGITDAQWWNTETDATNALNTIYAGIPDGTSGRQVMYWSGLSDEAVTRGDYKGEYDEFTRQLQNSSWGVGQTIWHDDYIDIRRANRFLEHVDKCYMDPQLKLRMKFEARALRAYYHMELMLFFGNIPLVTKSVTPIENQLARDSSEKVYRFIVSELQACADSLPKKYDNVDNWRINSGACEALISRLALYFHHYTEAKNAAKNVINSKVYALYHSADPGANSYAERFTYAGELNNERIFFAPNGCGSAWTTFAPFGIGGEVHVAPTASIVNVYETKQGKTLKELGADSMKIYEENPDYKHNRDPRLDAAILYPGEKFQNTYVLDPFNNPSDKIGAPKSTPSGFWIRKYLDPKDQQKKGGTLDFMIIRYAEVLLNYVESLEELGDWQNPDVVKYLNDIRGRAGMPDVNTAEYNSQTKMRQLIRRERQAELAFEGQRYFDIRRWGIADQLMNGTVYGATNPATGQTTVVEERKYDPNRDNLWPIPLNELNANPNMDQNPGYNN